MRGTYLIEVFNKPGVMDPVARGLQSEVAHAGLRAVKKITTGQLYRLVGQLTASEETRIARELLRDPVTQDYRQGDTRPEPKSVVVDIWYKTGVTDVVADSVSKGLRDLGVTGITEVRTGQRYRFWGLRDVKAADRFAVSLLANPLVQDRFVHAG